ncbi:unnamed protein product, partial [Symbiodinium sp. KB8]
YTRPPYETREPSVNLILNDVKRTAGMALGEHLEVHFHVGFEMWYEPFSELVGSPGFFSVLIDMVKILEATENAIQGFDSYSVPRDTAFLASRMAKTKKDLQLSVARSSLFAGMPGDQAELAGPGQALVRSRDAVFIPTDAIKLP